ncbi:MAG: PQQ-binding-like beta-propeller repeat protein [Hyphomonadaceae bacterium]
MNLRLSLHAAAAGLALGVLAAPALAQTPPDHPGRAVYEKTCSTCHATPVNARAPTLVGLQAMTPQRLREVISEGGIMAPMASGLSEKEKTDLIAWLTAGQATAPASWTDAIMCSADKRAVSASATVVTGGFGVDGNQTRSYTAAQAGLKKADLGNLEVAWAVAFPGQGSGTGASILSDGTMFVTGGQKVVALDAATGCAKWTYAASSRNTPAIGEINGKKVIALSVGRDIHVLDAATGALVWKASGQPVNGTGGAVRGGVIFAKDKIVVPLSASGVASGANAKSECCSGHGSVVVLNAKDGSHAWEWHTMKEPEYNGQVSSAGVKQKGPSGAPIWSVPVYDAKHNHVIVTSGENTSHPGTDTSDAVIALDLATGKVAWQFQAMAADVWNMACDVESGKNGPNCPVLFGGDGRDYDFGAGAIVTSAGGKDIVLAGQKSGHAWALDAKTGKVLWSQRVGEGTALGGVHWGITTDGTNMIVPINDPVISTDPKFVSKAGLYAFNIGTGKPAWSFAAKPDCAGDRGKLVSNCETRYGFSAAPLVIDGAVVGATLGGQVYVLDSKTGAVINKFDTIGPQKTLNSAIAGKGGSIDSHGVSAGLGMIFINSGYGSFSQTPGNVLIAYKPKK